ncbi:MAG: CoA synthetase, partial [Betaproteobacteria bacterium]|nr:CoA synthetase [Betaproteobacteria bacterium]
MVAVAPICPDIALFHAQAVDRDGNVFVGRDRDGVLLAHASKQSLITVEAQIDLDFIQDPLRAGATLPAVYVDGISLVAGGARPL